MGVAPFPIGLGLPAPPAMPGGNASVMVGSTPAEFGQVCAFLCSQQAGYMTGQNVLVDGGAFGGTF